MQRIWAELGLEADFRFQPTLGSLPRGRLFDLAWQWAACGTCRTPRRSCGSCAGSQAGWCLWPCPTPRQPGYLLRKYVAEPEFFRGVDESWTDIGRVRGCWRPAVTGIERGVMDVPPGRIR